MSNKTIKIAFDVDGTLIHLAGMLGDTPRYEIIAIYSNFERLGCDMYVWSGGGIDYATRWCEKLGLVHAKVIAKGSMIMDVVFDDEAVSLGQTNIQV